MKKGDVIRIQLHGHSTECADDCVCGGVHVVSGKVVDVLQDGFIKATIDDVEHPLALVDGLERVLTCSPEMYKKP